MKLLNKNVQRFLGQLLLLVCSDNLY